MSLDDALIIDTDIPVASGESKPLKQKHLYWYGDEGSGFVDSNEQLDVIADGVEAIAQTIYDNRGNVSIAAIGPMTNLAKVFQRHPDLATIVNHFYIMGNAIITQNAFYLNYRAHNLKADPEAADIVFAAPTPKTIVTTEVCKKNSFEKADFERIRALGTPAACYVYAAAMRWLGKIEQDFAHLYDPLVIHHIVEPGITSCAQYGTVRISVDVRPGFKGMVMDALTGTSAGFSSLSTGVSGGRDG